MGYPQYVKESVKCTISWYKPVWNSWGKQVAMVTVNTYDVIGYDQWPMTNDWMLWISEKILIDASLLIDNSIVPCVPLEVKPLYWDVCHTHEKDLWLYQQECLIRIPHKNSQQSFSVNCVRNTFKFITIYMDTSGEVYLQQTLPPPGYNLVGSNANGCVGRY